MNKLLITIFIVITLGSCKKDEPAPLEKTPSEANLDPESPLDPGEPEDLNPDVQVLSIDPNVTGWVESNTPIAFNSVAIGRKNAVTGIVNSISLSKSGWTHPSVLHFRNPWMGYKYWAAVTPYPYSDNQYENPHIFCSNDGVSWIEPAGILNPIESCPETPGSYHSDVNLIRENNKLYCYWRTTASSERSLWVKSSLDGVHWSEKQFICKWPASGVDVIAPSMVPYNNQYYCYGVSTGELIPGSYFTNFSVRKMVSSDLVSGFIPDKENGYNIVQVTNRPWGDQDPWHIEVKKINNIWLMLVTTTNHNSYGGGGRLFFGYSMDGSTFTFIAKPLFAKGGSTYKSSFHPMIDYKNKCIKIELWRAMMSDGWVVFRENFVIKAEMLKPSA